MYTLRARFKKDIVCEFLPPRIAGPSKKVIILCGGMPGIPSQKNLLFFLIRKGYWVFLPRYRGSWESGGSFLAKSPHQDILDIIDQFPNGFTDLWNNKKYKIKPGEIYIIGSSFGGPAALLASLDKRVAKVIAISPVIDWRIKSRTESLGWLGKFTRLAFGNGYRFTRKNWSKLKNGKFYNPIAYAKNMDGKKIFIIHAKDDKIVSYRPTKKFASITNSQLLLLKKGGHLGLSIITLPKFYKKISKFFKR